MEMLRKILRWVDYFTRWQGYILSVFLLTLPTLVIFEVVYRRVVAGTAWAMEVQYFHWALLLTATLAYAALARVHVRIDLLTTRYSPRIQDLLLVISYAVFTIPFIVFVAIEGWKLVASSIAVGEQTVMQWGMPIWPIKFFIVLGCSLLLFQSFAELIRHTYSLIKRRTL